MKQYSAPEMELIRFSVEDMIFNSPGPSQGGNDNDVDYDVNTGNI